MKNYTPLNRLDLELNYGMNLVNKWISFWIGILDGAIIAVWITNSWGYIKW